MSALRFFYKKTLKACRTFSFRFCTGRPFVQSANRKCLHFYYYFMDRDFGLIHVRIQSWFPLQIQVYLNGHGMSGWHENSRPITTASAGTTTFFSGSTISFEPRHSPTGFRASQAIFSVFPLLDREMGLSTV